MSISVRRSLIGFVVLAYVIFWALLGLTAALISLNASSAVQTLAKNVCAWAPTFSLLILFRRLYPGTKFRDFIKDCFGRAVNPVTLALLLAVQAAIVTLAIMAQLGRSGGELSSLTYLSPSALLGTLVITATSGPMGEELGWRGYLLRELQKRRTPFLSALLVGIIWGFWHTPLWIISGYTGTNLVLYVVYFLGAIVATSFIISHYYSKSGNLLVAMWIHFLFNFLLAVVKTDTLPLLGWTALGYMLWACVLILVNRRRMFLKPSGLPQVAEKRMAV